MKSTLTQASYFEYPSFSLHNVWELYSDLSYDVYKKEITKKTFVLIRTTSGLGILTDKSGTEYKLDQHTILLMPITNINRYYCAENIWDFWWFEFSCSDKSILPLNTVLRKPPLKNEKTKVYECIKALGTNNIISPQLASSYFSILVYKWIEDSIQKHDVYYEKEIRETVSYYRNNFDKNPKISELAAMVGICERRYNTLFKKIYIKSPKSYLNVLRLDISKEYLRNTSMSIEDISTTLGFSSSFHFSREFKRYFSIAPSVYRKL